VFLAADLTDEGVEGGREKKTKAGDAQHPKQHRRAQRLTHFGTGTGCNGEGCHAQDEREGGHQNWAKPRACGVHRCLTGGYAVFFLLTRELDNQDGVFGGQTDKNDKADLRQDVDRFVRLPRGLAATPLDTVRETCKLPGLLTSVDRSPNPRLAMKIRAKIDLAMLAAFVVGMGLAAVGAYTILKRNAIAESVQNGRIILEAASAIRSYTDKNIDPLLKEQLKVEFLPESIPFFAAKVNLQSLTKNLENYAYREPTLNPTNVNDQANDWEAGLIDGFRNDPQLTQSVTVRNTPAGDFLVLARPLKVDNAECLDCHSTPTKAPATVVALYGTDHGFGWKVGDTVGAQVVSGSVLI
jgi:hypothetical protein